MNGIRHAVVLLLILLLALPAPALAHPEAPGRRNRAAGEIIAVDAASGTFEIATRRGDDLTVFVTEETVFRSVEGEIQGVEDLEVGMKALVAGEPVEGGVSARVVGAARPGQLEGLKRFAGEVIHINLGLERFTLENRAGDQLVLAVNDATRFHSRQGDVEGFEDLERGMHALALYREVDGENLALAVGVRGDADRRRRPDVDVRAAGRIAEIDETNVTIEARGGLMVALRITERSVLRAPGGGEPEEGDLAIALGQYDDDGELFALLVVALPGHEPAPDRRP